MTLGRFEKLLNTSKMFNGLSRDALAKVANALKLETFQPDEVSKSKSETLVCIAFSNRPLIVLFPTVIEQGDDNYANMKFYVILDGIAQAAIKKPGSKYKSIGNLSSGDFFGERSLLLRAPRSATVYAKTKLRCGVLEIHSFERKQTFSCLTFLILSHYRFARTLQRAPSNTVQKVLISSISLEKPSGPSKRGSSSCTSCWYDATR